MKLRIGNVATIIAINLLLQFLVGCQGKSSPECILTLGISNMKIPAKEILRLEKRVNQAPRQIQLISGSKIILSGVQVGTVSDITFDHSTKNVRVQFDVETKYEEWIRADSTTEIGTQGVLGDKYIIIHQGSHEASMLPSGSKIPSEEGGGFDKFLSKGDELLVTLNSMAKTIDKLLKTLDRDKRTDRILDGMAATSKNLSEATAKLNQELTQIELKSTIRNLNEILKKINHGQGTLGALINDPALYDDAKALVGGANRSRIVRNLVRRTIKEGEEAYSDEAK